VRTLRRPTDFETGSGNDETRRGPYEQQQQETLRVQGRIRPLREATAAAAALSVAPPPVRASASHRVGGRISDSSSFRGVPDVEVCLWVFSLRSPLQKILPHPLCEPRSDPERALKVSLSAGRSERHRDIVTWSPPQSRRAITWSPPQSRRAINCVESSSLS
jgi:hypothetical protein